MRQETSVGANQELGSRSPRIWYAGSDHAGLGLKRALVAALKQWGDTVHDLGTHETTSVDYPEFGAAVGREVASHPGSLGLVVCGTGIGISIAANKIKGIRAALCTDAYTAQMARQHNDANVIAFGSRVTGEGVAEHALEAFRSASFAGDRHARRVSLLGALDSAR